VIETNWSPEFQHLILAAALRGDLLRQIPLDPELFRPRDKGPKPPEQRVAELAVKFYEKYKTKPTLAEFDQLLAEARFGPERVPEIADVMAAVRAAPVPEDLTSILDTVRDQIEKRRIEKALFESAPELDKPDGAERAREILAKAIAPGGNGIGGWPEPGPLPTGLSPVAAFDIAWLPRGFQRWVEDMAERMQCPVDYLAVSVMVVLASIVGRKVAIRPKREDDWTVVPNLWGAVIGEPGLMKTPALQEAMKPLDRLVAEARVDFARAQQQTAFEVKQDTIRRALLDADLKKAMKDGDTDRVAELKLEFEAEAEAEPVEKRYLVNDATVEKLGMLLNENPNGLLQFRDEMPGWLATMDRDGHENDRGFFDEAWNGTGAYYVDRVGRGTLFIPAACLSVLGGIQPGPLQAYLHEIFGKGLTNDGLIQRFQLMVWPDPPRNWKNVDRWPNTEAKNQTYEIFRALAVREQVGPEPVDGERPYLRFSPEAQAVFDTWRVELEARVAPGGADHPVVTSHLTKYRSLMPSLALLIHLVDTINAPAPSPVSVEAAQQAVRWCTYLESHARRVYQSVTAGGTTAALAIAARITSGAVPIPFRARTITQKGWAGLTEPTAVDRGLDTLEELNWIRQQDTPDRRTGGRPTVTYEVNPRVRREGSEGFEGESSQRNAPRARTSEMTNTPPPPPLLAEPRIDGETNPQNPQNPEDELDEYLALAPTAQNGE